MSYSPTIDLKSETIPGVTVVLRRLGFTRRIDLDTATLPFRRRQRELQLDYPPASPREEDLERQIAIARQKVTAVPAEEAADVIEKDLLPLEQELAACSTADTKKRRDSIQMEFSLVEAMIRQETLRAAVISVADDKKDRPGGDLDQMTVEQLLEYGPPELIVEILAVVSPDSRLQGTAVPNSPSPIISGAAETARKKSSTAPSVEAGVAAGIENATASSSSLPT